MTKLVDGLGEAVAHPSLIEIRIHYYIGYVIDEVYFISVHSSRVFLEVWTVVSIAFGW